MGIEISHETYARIAEEAQRQGVSVGTLLERLMSERAAAAHFGGGSRVPILHLGEMGPLHRRDIYEDGR